MLIGKQFGRYEIRTKIGSGGMGEIYAAYDAQLGRNVAVKILPFEFSSDENRKNRFRQEARAASALNHPNIITIYEIGENEHGNFLVTELIDGSTLREIIKQESLSIVQVLKIVEQVANALVAAHSAHIIHRDIKPENIMMRRDGIVKILDFGLAKPTVQEDADEKNNTLPGMVMGSVRYMSPEQARGIGVDERSDIWSLGVVLYELLTGRAPFDGETTSDTIAAVIYKEPEPILNFVQNAPAELQRIIRKSLQKDREERYQHIKDFALDVKELIYELEHETSGERMRTISSDINISENPTMTHQTHSTKDNGLTTSDIDYSGKKTKPRGWKIPLAILGTIVLLSVLAFGFYQWFGADTNLADDAFIRTQVSRVNTDGKVSAPAISPDGKYIAYISGDAENRGISVRQLSTDSVREIVPPTALSVFGVTFSPDGDYVYYLMTSEDGVVNSLYRVSSFGGESKKLIEDVDSMVTFSPDGKRLAFQRKASREPITIILTANIDGTSVESLIRSDETEFNIIDSPKWSPDGSVILVRTLNNFGGTAEKNEIAEISVRDKKLRVLRTKPLYSVSEFVWFKDGSGFLFTGQETANSSVQIYRAAYPGGEFHPVTNDINNYGSLGLTGDGKTIVTLKVNSSSSIWNFNPATKQLNQITSESANLEGNNGISQAKDGRILHTRKSGNDLAIWIMNADASNERQISGDIKNIFNHPKITPDGRYVVFGSKQSGTVRIWRIDADGKNPIQLTKEKANHGDFGPQITLDGKWVVYQEFASGANAESVFMKVSIDGGEPTLLYKDKDYNPYNPVISPDGKLLAYDSYGKADFDKKVRVVSFENNVFGQMAKEFSADLINNYLWSPDGKSLTILSNRSGAPNLWRMPLDGGATQPVTDFKTGRISNFTWSSDGKTIYIVRGSINSDLILIRDSSVGK